MDIIVACHRIIRQALRVDLTACSVVVVGTAMPGFVGCLSVTTATRLAVALISACALFFPNNKFQGIGYCEIPK